MAKLKKTRADKYDEKLVIKGSFDDVIKASFSPTFRRIKYENVPTATREFEVGVYQGAESIEIRTYEKIDGRTVLLPQITISIPIVLGQDITPNLFEKHFNEAKVSASIL